MQQPFLLEAIHEAKERLRAGRWAETEAICRAILERDPTHREALRLLSTLASQARQTKASVQILERLTALHPDDGEAWSELGDALHADGCFEMAAAAHREALRRRPDAGRIWNDLGNALHAAGRIEEAIVGYREALRLEPALSAAQINLGNALEAAGRLDEAIAAQRAAIRLAPENAPIRYHLGNILAATGQIAEAASSYREAVRIDPGHWQAHNQLANVLFSQGQVADAIEFYVAAARANPHFAEAYRNLGNALQTAGRLDEAIAVCREATRLQPNDAIAFCNLGNALNAAGNPDESAAACLRAVQLDPSYAAAQSNLGKCLKDQGRLDEAVDCFRKAVALQPDAPEHGSNLLLCLHYHPAFDAGSILSESRRWNERHAQPLRGALRRHENDPSPDRRLRIGYVSPDFRQHVMGCALFPLLHHHDSEKFEIFCYSNSHEHDLVTRQLRAKADSWREVASVGDEETAEMIREDRIDILIDLSMHAAGNRLLVFARKPAPVQATYLAYCSTTGLETMDYRLSDPYMDPPELDAACYAEKTIRLRRSYWCYYPPGEASTVTPEAALKRSAVRFGCLNHYAKVSDPALELWMDILQATSNSSLLLNAAPGLARQRITAGFRRRSIDLSRLEFVGLTPWPEYLRNWQSIDIGLDPFPYGGGITTCDALWMGTPVVSLSGRTGVGRGGRSILSNVGCLDLIAETPQEYVRIAVALAEDRPRLSELRSGLRERVERSPLRDAAGMTRDIESAYREMWTAWCRRSPSCTGSA